MDLSKDYILQSDLDKLLCRQEIDWTQLQGTSILVTGATGLIGGQIVSFLLHANRKLHLDLKVYALVRDIEKGRRMFPESENNTLFFVAQDILEPIVLNIPVDYIIHGASVTSSKDFVDYPVETIKTALCGTENILEFARKSKISSMVYLSSLEIYGVLDFSIDKVTENMSGELDCMSVRSSYSEGKRMAECLCAAYASEFSVPVKVARLSQTFGPGVSYNDNRVFAQFARCIIEGKNIVLKTDGSTTRNYCYTQDAIAAIFTILLKGNSGEAYNVANESTDISIKEMAEMLIACYPNSGANLVFDIAPDATKLGYNPKMKICLSTQKLQKLGWSAKIGLEQMFNNLIESMRLSSE